MLVAIAVIALKVRSFDGVVSLADGKPAKNAVVSLLGSEKPAPMKQVIVDQRDRTFVPHVSVVTVGTTVQFPNDDTVFHNVFTEFHSTRFDLGMYARGQSRSQTFSKPGLAVLLCSVHPNMSAYIMVVDTPYFAITDSTGRFRIKNVPAGHYRLEAWQESGQKLEKSIDVSSAGPVRIALEK